MLILPHLKSILPFQAFEELVEPSRWFYSKHEQSRAKSSKVEQRQFRALLFCVSRTSFKPLAGGNLISIPFALSDPSWIWLLSHDQQDGGPRPPQQGKEAGGLACRQAFKTRPLSPRIFPNDTIRAG